MVERMAILSAYRENHGLSRSGINLSHKTNIYE